MVLKTHLIMRKMHLRLCHSSLYMYMMQYSSRPAVLHIVDLQSFIGYIFATPVDCLLISFYYQRWYLRTIKLCYLIIAAWHARKKCRLVIHKDNPAIMCNMIPSPPPNINNILLKIMLSLQLCLHILLTVELPSYLKSLYLQKEEDIFISSVM